MDSIKLMLPKNLDRILHLSQDSFQTIRAGEDVTVDLSFKAAIGEKKEVFMQSYNGELIIASEHHNWRKIPIQIEWNEVESEHFTVYARSGDESIAKQVIDLLEKNYQNVTRFDEEKKKKMTKTTIYMAGSMDEMKTVNPSGHSYYSYRDDAIFVCACDDDAATNALKEFIYKIIIKNVSYHKMKLFSEENWLLDGISSYIATNITATSKYIDAFTTTNNNNTNTVTFQWYGYGSLEQYGATHTFFEYLESKYGTEVIDKALHYQKTGRINDHRCDTTENCAVLQAVYDAIDLDIENERYTLDVKTLIKEWKEYLVEHYSVTTA